MSSTATGSLYVQIADRPWAVKALRRDIAALRRKYPALLDRSSPIEPAQQLMDWVFPDGMRGEFAAANLTLKDDPTQMTVAIRRNPPSHGAWPFPAGIALVATGFWERKAKYQVLRIQGFQDCASGDLRDFERPLQVFTYQVAQQPAGSQFPDNVLTKELADSLEPISRVTRDKLIDWTDFIEWKRRLIQRELRGLLYTSVRVDQAKLALEFAVVSGSAQDFADAMAVLDRPTADVTAYRRDDSRDKWRFEPDLDGDRIYSGTRLGNVLSSREDGSPSTLSGSPWSSSVRYAVSVALTDEDRAEVEQSEDAAAALEGIRSRLPQSGFLAVSAAGDLVLLRRHERAVDRLRDQGGFAPYLSSYLFDATEARPPKAHVTDIDWVNTDLNPAQRSAVTKILEAPDLCLIQGPPGTGKTTVIAEAIIQLARRGQSVLLASQTHIAVDNALERLASESSLRVVRLSGVESRVSRDGQQFMNDAALRRYYNALASHSQGVRDNWSRNESEMAQFEQYIPVADERRKVVKAALEALRNHQMQSDQFRKDWVAEQETIRAIEDRNRVRKEQRSQLEQLLEAVNSRRYGYRPPAEVDLPEPSATELALSIYAMSSCKVALPHGKSKWEKSADRAPLLVELLAVVAKLSSALPVIEADASRLKDSKDGLLVDAEAAEELAALRIRRAELDDLLEGDDTYQSEWREVRRRIRALESERGELRDEHYRIFKDGEDFTKRSRPGFLKRKVSSDDLHKLGRALSKRVAEARESLHSTQTALSRFLVDLEASIDSLHPIVIDDAAEHAARERLETHNARQSEVTNRLRDAISNTRLTLDLAPREAGQREPEADAEDLLAVLGTMITSRKKALKSLREQVTQESQERKTWDPVLSDWIQDLQDAQSAERDWETFRGVWVPECNVVAITCNERERTLEEAQLTSFDVAIIDEVSKATPLEMLLPLMRARRSVLVGDHRQLPPMFKESNDARAFIEVLEDEEEDASSLNEQNLSRFQKLVTASLFKSHFETADDALKERLNVQFRMHPQIMDLVNNFYEGTLKCGLPPAMVEKTKAHGMTLAGQGIDPWLTPDHHVIWVDTTRDLRGALHRNADRGSKWNWTNRLEAQLIAHTLAQMNEACRSQGYGKDRRKQVGIVSFYANQVRAIRDEIRRITPKGRFDCLDYEVNTVIRYQGKEKPVILVSLVANYGVGKEGRPVRLPDRANVARFEYVNVAFSRAQELLVVFGACSTFQPYPVVMPMMDHTGSTTRNVYGDIIASLSRQGALRESRELGAAPPAPPNGKGQGHKPARGRGSRP